ncbi:kinesin-like protein KIF23 [Diorhabda carinulata]|uniref:kinesin-like protein KIF23 n=1 Tax=Diorhabda carinulata TaxID=1163345 RepID=UPI0025A24555|nr:kinesin-like protein KIF23 [Diorhabda carinulata]
MFSATKYTPTPKRIRREKTTVSTSSSDVEKDPVHVYCRLRPLQETDIKSCMTLLSPQEICISNESKGIRRDISYKFKHIFTSLSTQKEIFDHVGYPLLEDLLKGKNGLLFTYGVTGSGKTYTLTGDQNNPGVMPRCIDTIFNSINEFQSPKYMIKSDKMNGFEIQTEEDAAQDRLCENRALLKTPKGSRKINGDKIFFTNDGTRIQVLNETNLYAVFISYIEIYNNNVYDLLDESSNGKTLQNKILREDQNRNMYVNGVTELEVKSAQETFELFLIGQKRKKMAYTNLNAESSRSHSVFNIRIAQLEKISTDDNRRTVVPEKNLLTVSQLSLVDLAGSERSSRTQNTGARLKEASCINNSLMNLRTCLEILRENQRLKGNKVVPYRDSRLTYLFKNYFEGDGSVQMIVCVNPSVNDLEENIHVMKFAEMTQDVKIIKSDPKPTAISTTKKGISKRVATPAKIQKATLFSVLPKIPIFKFDFTDAEECGNLIDNVIRILKHSRSKSKELDSDITKKNLELRKRLVNVDNKKVLNKAEIRNLNQIINRQQVKNNNLETKVSRLETEVCSLVDKNKELQGVIRSLHNTINEKDLKLNQNVLEKERTKQKIALASEKMSQELDAKLKKQREHLNAAMLAKEIQLKKVREALETDIIINPVEMNIENIPPSIQTPMTPTESSQRHMAGYTPRPRRRSKSADEVWLEHNSIKPVPLGTVLQPSMKKRKSVSKLTKASDVTNPKQSKYCLLAQEQDKDGEIETKVYKADILPTTGGGAQVIFNDVERLRQQSPTAD